MKLTFKPKSPEALVGLYAAREDEQVFEYFMRFCEMHGLEVLPGISPRDYVAKRSLIDSLCINEEGLVWSPLGAIKMKRLTLSDLFYTVEEFLAGGYELVAGDVVYETTNRIVTVKNPDVWNQIGGYCDPFVISAAAPIDIETPEEKEAAEAMSKNEEAKDWSGEGLPPVGVECEILFKKNKDKGFGLFKVLAYHGSAVWAQYVGQLSNNGKCYTEECSELEFRSVETTGQRDGMEPCNFKSAWRAVKAYEEGEELYIRISCDGEFERVRSASLAMAAYQWMHKVG